MILFALSPWWNDFFAVGGFVVGILGLVIGVGGFWIAIWQIRKTKHAFEAAQESATITYNESKKAYERYVVASASSLIRELQNAVNVEDWKLATIRSIDLGALLASLPSTGVSDEDDAIDSSVAGLRAFGQTFAELVSNANRKRPYQVKKWKTLLQLLHTRLDQLRVPFGEVRHGQRRSNDSGADPAPDRTDASRQDEGRGSELDTP